MPLPFWVQTDREDGSLSSLFSPTGGATVETGVNAEPVVTSWLFPEAPPWTNNLSAASNLVAAVSQWEGHTSTVALTSTVDGSSADLYESIDNDYAGTTDLTISMGASQTRDIRFYAPSLPGALWTADVFRLNMWISGLGGHSGTGWNYQPFVSRVRNGVTQTTVFGGTFTNVGTNAWLTGTITGLIAGLGTFGASDGLLHGWRITTSASPANPTSIMALNHPTYSLPYAVWGGTGQNKQLLSVTGFTAQSALAATADKIVTGSAALSVQSALTSTAAVAHTGAATFTAQTSLTSTGVRVVPGTSSLTAQSSHTATATVTALGSASLTVQSALTATAVRIVPASSSNSVQSSLTASGVRVVVGTSSLTSQTALTATADIAGGGPTAALTAASSLTASGVNVRLATSSLTAQSTFTSTAIRVQVATSALTAQSGATVNAVLVQLAAATFTAQSTFTSAAIRVTAGTSALTAQSALTGTAHFLITGASSLTVQSGMSADAIIPVLATSTLTGGSTFTAVAMPIYRLELPNRSTTRTRNVLFGRYGESIGVALLLKDGVGKLKKYPSDFELTAADAFWLGGYNYQISPTERDAVVAAGFGGLIEEA